MGYYLGIDLGTTYTAAAVWRDGRVEIASLGNRAPTIPSVVLLREDEEVLTGEAAERRALTEPRRVAREFKRRIGDPTPMVVGGTPYSADALTAKLLRWVVDKISEIEGGPPDGIAISYPANWGDYKQDLLRQAIAMADLDDVSTLTEPEAGAIHYASQERIETGSVIAVFDLGGGTFDAAVLRKGASGWEVLGDPQGIERLGGVDFDEAVYQHVVAMTDGAVEELDPDDATAAAAMTRLRQECVAAKEALSSDTEATIPVLLPNLQTEVRITRGEFEHMVRPALGDAINALRRALRSADVAAEDVSAVLLVGGSSRIPLVGQLVSSEFGRPVAVDAHPKHGIALGAAIVAAERAEAGSAATTEVEELPDEPVAPAVVAPVAPGPRTEPATDGGRRRPVGLLIGAGLASIAAIAVIAAMALGGGDDDPEVSTDTTEATSDDTEAPEATDPPETAPPTEAPAADPEGPFVRIDAVLLDGDRYRTEHTALGFTPEYGGPDSLHIHFFLDSTEPADAGTNGNPPGDWEVSDEPTSLRTQYGPDNRGDAAQLCAVVATVDHEVLDPDSGTCVDLPG
jgi:molecular chaperone DnaK